ncbi:hypothetical protein LTR10_016750 [Elasticomyces elasticus]|uniref:Thiolase N-terminal domain-containing protein n=1 Tax=Exophiala sideris TaxID=1016849 RepID=A0ABR0JML9_9EURO|nr:hypothetical protein LTR10_016750 [Elasticomyces elasticus]KAK5037754.1 hypothetical protein LTS07_001221 [Exophiala sideris]KAK5043736.1 hypothetical protein LTR13_000090 [Exophiala sideris]KAK5067235.1 hypothetical protein LTR69_001222 [Exophiala sideris]KAK5182568.1 hypothetical protein LTR44_004959 [Eurotiomycetes sp. CCFEE 6388]
MSAKERIKAVACHLSDQATKTPSAGLEKILQKSPDDIVITCAVRTPLTKARKVLLFFWPFANSGLDGSYVLELTPIPEVVNTKSQIDPNLVEDISVGVVLQPSASFVARTAVLAAGFPVTTGASVTSRFCSSGLLSIQSIASSIAIGAIDVGIAVGCESMSCHNDKPPKLSPMLMNHPIAKDSFMPVGWTSENVAGDFGITREMQDRIAVTSHNKAEEAQKRGWSADEIVPIATQWKDPKTGEVRQIVVDKDDGIRPGTTYEALSKLRGAFPQWKPTTTTGGNASQVTDGAAAVLMMKRSTAERLGQNIIGKYVMSTIVGLEPRIMGIGPVYAIPKVLEKTGLTKDDIDLFKINEAFASMVC